MSRERPVKYIGFVDVNYLYLEDQCILCILGEFKKWKKYLQLVLSPSSIV